MSAQQAIKARAEAEGLIEFMISDLQDKLKPIGRLDLLDAVNQRVRAYYDAVRGQKESQENLRQRGGMLDNEGDVRRAKGDLPGASTSYRNELEIARKLALQDPANVQWQQDLERSYEKVGDVLREQGDLAGALNNY